MTVAHEATRLLRDELRQDVHAFRVLEQATHRRLPPHGERVLCGCRDPICAAPRAHLAASLALLSVLGSDGPHELELEGHVVRVDLVLLSVVFLQRRQQQLRDLLRHLLSGQPARRLHRSSERVRRARRTRTGAGGRWREGRTSHAGSPVAFFLTCLFVFGPLRHGTGQAEQGRRWACGGGRGSAQRGRGVVAGVAVVMRGGE